MKIIVSIAVAMVLGVTVMFLPIVMHTQVSAATHSQWLSGGESEKFDQDVREAIAAAEAATSLVTIDDAAQTLGKLDTGPSPFPSSLSHVILVVVTGLLAAMGVSLYSRKRIGARAPVRGLLACTRDINKN